MTDGAATVAVGCAFALAHPARCPQAGKIMRTFLNRLFLVLVCSTLFFAGAALAAGAKKNDQFSNQDYNNDLMLDRISYRGFLNGCDADRTTCVRMINFISFKYADGRFACRYKPKDLQTVAMGVVTVMKFALKKSPDFAKHTGDELRGAVIGSLDFLGKTCAERLKNAGG